MLTFNISARNTIRKQIQADLQDGTDNDGAEGMEHCLAAHHRSSATPLPHSTGELQVTGSTSTLGTLTLSIWLQTDRRETMTKVLQLSAYAEN